MLMPDERALFREYCNDHPIAVCHQCSEAVTFDRIGADIIMGKRDFCPMCRADLTNRLREHLAACTLMRVQAREIRARSREVRQESRETSTELAALEITPRCARASSQERPATQPQREIEVDLVPRLNDPKCPDETRDAVQESEPA